MAQSQWAWTALAFGAAMSLLDRTSGGRPGQRVVALRGGQPDDLAPSTDDSDGVSLRQRRDEAAVASICGTFGDAGFRCPCFVVLPRCR